MAVALLSFFSINQSSNRQSMNSYYQFLGESLGSEVIEFCHGMGYNWAIKYMGKHDVFPLNKWHNCLAYPIFNKTGYFRECGSFERKVTFTKVSDSSSDENAVLVIVKIRTKQNTKAKSWLNSKTLYFSTLIEKEPQK